jgi:hypothetical protein
VDDGSDVKWAMPSVFWRRRKTQRLLHMWQAESRGACKAPSRDVIPERARDGGQLRDLPKPAREERVWLELRDDLQ